MDVDSFFYISVIPTHNWGVKLFCLSIFQVADFDLETGGGSSVAGLVLEAPFNCMRDEVMTFKAAQALQTFVNIEQTLEQSDLEFKTNKWLPAVKVHGTASGQPQRMLTFI